MAFTEEGVTIAEFAPPGVFDQKVVIKIFGKKCDVRWMFLPEDSDKFSFGKGLRFPKELGPQIAAAILKACKEE